MSTELINDLLTLSLVLFFVSLFYRFFFGFLLFLTRDLHHKYCYKKKQDKIIYSTVLWFIVHITLLIYKHL